MAKYFKGRRIMPGHRHIDFVFLRLSSDMAQAYKSCASKSKITYKRWIKEAIAEKIEKESDTKQEKS